MDVDNKRVWIYQTARLFSREDKDLIEKHSSRFLKNWFSHGRQVKGDVYIMEDRFIVVEVDETDFTISGCGIDSSVNFIRELNKLLERDLFNRMLVHYISREGILKSIDLNSAKEKYARGEIDDNTSVLDTTLNNSTALRTAWKKPLKDTWLKRSLS